MNNDDLAVFTCGYCKTETKIENSTAIKAVTDNVPVSFCICERISYASKIRLKVTMGDFKAYVGEKTKA